MIDLISIRPGRGIGDLRFGSTREEVGAHLGEPDQLLDGEAGPGTEIWIYEAAAVALSFAAEEGLRFVSCETFNERAHLGGNALIGLDRAGVEALLDDEQQPEYEWFEDEGASGFYIDDYALNLWFDEEKVSSIGWAVLVEENGTVVWP